MSILSTEVLRRQEAFHDAIYQHTKEWSEPMVNAFALDDLIAEVSAEICERFKRK